MIANQEPAPQQDKVTTLTDIQKHVALAQKSCRCGRRRRRPKIVEIKRSSNANATNEHKQTERKKRTKKSSKEHTP